MELRAVKNINKPKYAIMEQYAIEPKRLLKHVPKSWLKNEIIAGALSVFVLGSCTSADKSNNSKANNPQSYVLSDFINQINGKKVQVKEKMKIAPIFAHGEGSGAIGCISMSSPVFISEEEAREIIFDALSEKGLEVDTTTIQYMKFDNYPLRIKVQGYIKKLNLVVVYYPGQYAGTFSYDDGGTHYNTKYSAESIREKFIEEDTFNAGIFYDPLLPDNTIFTEGTGVLTNMIEFFESFDPTSYSVKKKAKRLLLAQVEDFIEWLEKEKLIK